jgi:hypothetical protein
MFQRRDPKRLDKRVHELPRGVVVLLEQSARKGVAGCRGPWDKMMEPNWFAMPSSPRTSGFSCSRAEPPLLTQEETLFDLLLRCVHCRHTCAAIRKVAAPVLLPHQRPPTCLRVVYCFAYARAYGNEPSWPLAKHFRSHSRTRQFNSVRTSESCNSAALSICCDAIRAGLPLPPVLHCASNSCHVAPALTALPLRSAAAPSELAAL